MIRLAEALTFSFHMGRIHKSENKSRIQQVLYFEQYLLILTWL